jgi:hypothetical protein
MKFFNLKNNSLKEAIGDYRYEKTYFSYKNMTYDTINIEQIYINIIANNLLNGNKYGNCQRLTNGINIFINNEANNLFEDNIYSNEDWLLYCSKIEKHSFDISKTFMKVIINCNDLVLKPGEKISVLLNDDLTNLTRHTFTIKTNIQPTST